MNILYIHSHDTGRCLQPYGYPVSMPAIQRLAESGVLFRRAFSAAPTCSPSRAALLTGEAPHSTGMLGLAHRGFELTHPAHHLAAFLRSNGYRTVLAGHQHLTVRDPRELGYDEVFESGDGLARIVAPNAVTFLQNYAATPMDAPFFLDVGFTETHRPFPEAPESAARYLSVLPGLPDRPEIRLDIAGFEVSLRALDSGVGMVLDALNAAGLSDSTMVLLTTDHGPPFPGMKSTLTDGGLGVGCILRIPGTTRAGSIEEALISQIDLYPTVCELLDLEPPGWLQGVSLAGLLAGAEALVRNEVFGEVTYHAAYEPQRSIRTDRWTYIRRFNDRAQSVLPNIDASPTLDCLLEIGWDRRSIPLQQLFDNWLDPMQAVNLAASPEHSAIASELELRLNTWMRETSDPLLDGPVPLPTGTSANRPSDRSPDDELYQSNAH